MLRKLANNLERPQKRIAVEESLQPGISRGIFLEHQYRATFLIRAV